MKDIYEAALRRIQDYVTTLKSKQLVVKDDLIDKESIEYELAQCQKQIAELQQQIRDLE